VLVKRRRLQDHQRFLELYTIAGNQPGNGHRPQDFTGDKNEWLEAKQVTSAAKTLAARGHWTFVAGGEYAGTMSRQLARLAGSQGPIAPVLAKRKKPSVR